MKVATWNVNSLKVRLPQVLDWLAANAPDVLCVQETKLTDDCFPAGDIEAAGYHAVYAGEKTYNGVAMMSRQPLTDVLTDPPGLDDPQRRVLGATCNGLRLLNLYVVNGQEVGSAKYAWKLEWLSRMNRYLKSQLGHGHLLVLGDFNIAPEDRDVYDPEFLRDQILCSTAERAALKALLDLGLVDTFRMFEQEDKSFTWWDYRAGAFRRNQGLRIDLILASQSLAFRCTTCRIDKEPRRLDRPSDHAPVIAEFTI